MRTLTFLLMFVLAFVMVTAEQDGVARLMVRNNTNKQKDKIVNSKMTFYDGEDLKNAACYGQNGLPTYNAKRTDMIGAMAMKHQEMCYQCLQLRNKKNNKKVIVKIIDECEGCDHNQVDVTPKAFSQIADPDLGVVKISWKPVSCPSKGRFPTFENKHKKRGHH